MLEFGVATTISPSPARDHVKVHERYPVPTHTPRTQVCCAGHVDGQGISSNNNDSNFVIYDFSIDLPVVVVVDVLVDVLVDMLIDVLVDVVDAVYVVIDAAKNFKIYAIFCMYYIDCNLLVILL